MWIIGAFVKVNPPPASASSSTTAVAKPLSSEGIAAVFFFYLWTAFYTPSWNGTPWVINSEMFDMNTRALGQASAAANNWFWNFIISRFTPQSKRFPWMPAEVIANVSRAVFQTMSYGVYFFFASLMIMSIVFVYFFIPETKSVPLESMDRLFAIRPASKANKTIVKALQEEDARFRTATRGASLDAARTDDMHAAVEKEKNVVQHVEKADV